ncbi:hypothetical protein J3F83DRAFT_598954 [Trichoderma novae-zelandiae]
MDQRPILRGKSQMLRVDQSAFGDAAIESVRRRGPSSSTVKAIHQWPDFDCQPRIAASQQEENLILSCPPASFADATSTVAFLQRPIERAIGQQIFFPFFFPLYIQTTWRGGRVWCCGENEMKRQDAGRASIAVHQTGTLVHNHSRSRRSARRPWPYRIRAVQRGKSWGCTLPPRCCRSASAATRRPRLSTALLIGICEGHPKLLPSAVRLRAQKRHCET